MKKIVLLAVIITFSSIFALGQSISPDYQTFSVLEPDDIQYSINWGMESEITAVYYYYWDESDDYQEVIINQGTAYTISGNNLTILQTWIEAVPPEPGRGIHFYAQFGLDYIVRFNIEVIYTIYPSVFEDSKVFDLSNKDDVFVTIAWAESEGITSVSVNGTPISSANYIINGDWLFIKEAYLNTVLLALGNSINVSVSFDEETADSFIIEAINTGVTNPSLSQYEFDIAENNMPEYIETVITWNDASEISSMDVIFVDGGYPISTPFEDYTVTPINAETANLRMIVGSKGKKTDNSKATDEYSVSVEIEFNVGASAFYYITIIDEFYFVYSDVLPANSGYVSGAWEYYVNEEVSLEAAANTGFEFLCWKIAGAIVSTDNPYIFNMPANDIYITAHFVPQGATLYDVILVSNPVGAGVLSGAGQYMLGETVTINLIENTGYEFVNWTDATSTAVASTPQHSFIMADQNVTLTANFNDNSNIDEDAVNIFEIFPNPFSDILYISNYQSAIKVSFTTITGQVIAEFNNLENRQINTANLPKGFYLLILENKDGERLVKKILKQ